MIEEIIKEVNNKAMLIGKASHKMTTYRAQLIQMKLERYTDQQIAEIIKEKLFDDSITGKKVNTWINNVQPRDEVIEILEQMFMNKVIEHIETLKNPNHLKRVKK